nr:MAG TPA: hypothetical protein [Caudoviricetes sp.]
MFYIRRASCKHQGNRVKQLFLLRSINRLLLTFHI